MTALATSGRHVDVDLTFIDAAHAAAIEAELLDSADFEPFKPHEFVVHSTQHGATVRDLFRWTVSHVETGMCIPGEWVNRESAIYGALAQLWKVGRAGLDQRVEAARGMVTVRERRRGLKVVTP